MNDELMVRKIVNYMIQTGTKETYSGNWIFSASDLCEEFDVTVDWLMTNTDDIMTDLFLREEVADIEQEIEDDVLVLFDVTFYTNYCENLN